MDSAPTSVIAGVRGAARSAVTAVGRWGRRLRERVLTPTTEARSTREAPLLAWARKHPRRALLGGLSGMGLLAIAFWPGGEDRSLLVAAVQEGPFEVTILESGTLRASRSVGYSSSIPGNQAKIVYLAPEGSHVEKGDLLVRFDSTPFEEERRQTEAQLAQARAELVKAEQDLRLMKLRNAEEVAEAQDKQRLAELELASVTEGKGQLAEAESEVKVAQARRELEKAIANYEDLKPFLEEGFITKLELDRARQAVEKAQEDLRLLEIKHQTYIEYTRPAEIEGARAAVHNRNESLRQLNQAASYRLSQAEAALDLAQSKVSELDGKLALAEQNLKNCELHSTVVGMVIYKEIFFGSEERKVQIGDQVWPNQPIVEVPDLGQMVVQTQVRETDIHKVEENQRVLVLIEAYPDLRLEGEVSFIGTLAHEEAGQSGPKYFEVTVLVRDLDPRLRPGMSARVELLVEQIENARFVPLESVFERAGRRYAYVLRNGEPEVQEILTGPSNENHIVVEAGLDTGERVLLRDPSDEGRPLGSEGTSLLDARSPVGPVP